MARVRVKWNRAAFVELRTRPAVIAELESLAEGIAARAGDGFEAQPVGITGGRVRGRTAVVTTTGEAMHRQATDHVLEASL